MIELSDVLFRYRDGEFELRIPELTLARGEQVGLIGPSGSGKTTLLHLVAGIERPERGRIAVDGTAMSELSDASTRAFRIHKLGLVFQDFALLEHLSVLDNVLLPYRITRVGGSVGGLRRQWLQVATWPALDPGRHFVGKPKAFGAGVV